MTSHRRHLYPDDPRHARIRPVCLILRRISSLAVLRNLRSVVALVQFAHAVWLGIWTAGRKCLVRIFLVHRITWAINSASGLALRRGGIKAGTTFGWQSRFPLSVRHVWKIDASYCVL